MYSNENEYNKVYNDIKFIVYINTIQYNKVYNIVYNKYNTNPHKIMFNY